MEAKQSSGGSLLDTMKLALALAVAVSGVVAYYYFPSASVLLRVPAVLAGLGIGLAIAATASQGRQFVDFMRGARVELRKVVWPKREETIQTTLIVLLFAITMGVFFWVLDLGLGWVVRLITGRG
ncbi:MAG: preprotein translocase subunit SecE [Pseudomonadota bacterium]